MHKCSKCGRAASSLEEIDAGCPCGSKVFIFDRQIAQAVVTEGNGGAAAADGAGKAIGAPGGNGSAANGGNESPAVNIDAPSTFAVPDTSKDKAQEMPGALQEGKVPESYFARTSFTNDDIENIKVLTQGVFLLDVNAISKNPVVLKDEDEIYYVKLPMVQKKSAAPAPAAEPEKEKKE